MRKKILLFVLILFISANIYAQDKKRDQWQQPERIIEMLGIKPGMHIGEAGAGDGYFTFFLAKKVGINGRCYANDINTNSLQKLWKRAINEKVNNISIVIGEFDDPLFPLGKMDMVISMLMFHEIDNPVEFLKNTKKCLKPGAFVVIIDRDPDKYGQNHSHFKTKEYVIENIKKANYEIIKLDESLPRDYVFIIRPKV